MSNKVYLDYAATAPLLPEAKAAMLSAMDAQYGNPSALHTAGHAAANLIEEARAEVAALIGAKPREIIFTSGGSEANNAVMNIFADQPVAVSAIEHPSVLESAKARCKTRILSLKDIAAAARGDAMLVSIMLANNELGTLFDIKSLTSLAHSYGSEFHSDAIQALGKLKINVNDLGVDYLTVSAHKIGGPVGIGALYVRTGAPYEPLILGGHQENGRRAGTSPVVNIAGFGAAAKYAREHATWGIYEKNIRPLRDLLARRILKEIPGSSLNTDLKNSLPNVLNVSFAAAEGESIQLYLDLEGHISVSTGSACASGSLEPSHVIMALTGDAEIAHSSVRFSFGLDSTKADVDAVMDKLPGIIHRLQGISTIKRKD